MIINTNKNIFEDAKMHQLDEFLVLLDRAGFNDNILAIHNDEENDKQIDKQIKKINNETIFYCHDASQSCDNSDLQKDIVRLTQNHKF